MNTKRAQAAMEFLMTYGWAILVVLVVIGALAYFGILNPNTLLPERCEVQMGLYCKDHLISTRATGIGIGNGSILLILENGRGTDIKITQIIATSTSFEADGNNCSYNIERILRNGEQKSFTINDTDKTSCYIPIDYKGTNTKVKWDLVIKWHSLASGLAYSHTAGGQLMAAVE